VAFDTVGFLDEYHIDYVTEGHKHCRPGWVQVECPFCFGNPGYHLGFNLDDDYWNCWRCGYHKTWEVVLALLNDNRGEARKALAAFKGRPTARHRHGGNRPLKRVLELPTGELQPLTKRAKRYLQGRKFDPDLIELIWDVKSTANYGEFKYRIFIPIYLNNKMVSWQCRDVLGTSSFKYLSQSEDKEIISNKDTLYGIDQATGNACVVVEGVTDVWRLGPGSVATFGIKYKPSQVKMLISNFENFHIAYDPEDQAQKQANGLAADLAALGGKVKVWDLGESDPGDLSQSEADELMRLTLGRTGY